LSAARRAANLPAEYDKAHQPRPISAAGKERKLPSSNAAAKLPEAESPLDDVVARQYNRWVYPEPIQDLVTASPFERQMSDPALNYEIFWPDRDYPRNLDILVAGCGSNQAASIAFHNRTARVVGIDVSEASLAHEQYLKDKHDLANLELQRLPLEAVADWTRDFDLIMATGVIHHLADPLAGMKALGSRLRRDGVFFVMVYAHYGRLGIEALQSLFRMLDLKQDEPSLAVVKDTLARVGTDHLIQPYRRIATDLNFDGGMVDTFLHGRDEIYTVAGCLDLTSRAGLSFQGWLENSNYYPESMLPADSLIYQAINRLAPQDMWAAMEQFATQNACHFFLACRPDRPKESYVIDFSSPRFLDWIPKRRYNLEVLQGDAATGKPAQLKRGSMTCPVTTAHALLFNPMDGKRTVRAIMEAAVAAGLQAESGKIESFTREFFRSLWRLGLINIRLPASPA
jgi:SAM-dependent methyltransferase